MRKDKIEHIIEYAVYHDNLDKKISLPGIKNGFPIKSFFSKKSDFKIKDFEYLTKNIINDSIKNINEINLLCSGGVDSSLLVYFLNEKNKKFITITNYYPNHKLNDLYKIKSLSKFQKFKLKKIEITSKNYLKGMKLSFKNNYFGNTYAPTLYYSLDQLKNNKNKILMTGSGPDELFYGMEKYDLKFFKRLSNLKTNIALEKIDTNYNYNFYKNILNSYGLEILNNIIKKRRNLYREISEINNNIFEAQRILAYCTVSNQHFEMFEKISKNYKLNHVSPFLNINYIKFAFSIKLANFLNIQNERIKLDSNVGKKQLKEMLTLYTSKKHAYDKKIGFHAPVSKMINENRIRRNLNYNLNLDRLEKIIDIDKLFINLNKNSVKNLNYNIYSLIGVNNMIV